MQLIKGLWNGEVTYLALLNVEELVGAMTTMPRQVAGILEEFEDVTPTKLPRSLQIPA